MMKKMALELDTDLIKEDVNLSDILITIDKLKSQVSQIPEYGFKKMAIEDQLLEIEETIKDMM